MHHASFSTLNFRFTYIEAKVTGKLLPNMEPMIIIMSFEMLSDKLIASQMLWKKNNLLFINKHFPLENSGSLSPN